MPGKRYKAPITPEIEGEESESGDNPDSVKIQDRDEKERRGVE